MPQCYSYIVLRTLKSKCFACIYNTQCNVYVCTAQCYANLVNSCHYRFYAIFGVIEKLWRLKGKLYLATTCIRTDVDVCGHGMHSCNLTLCFIIHYAPHINIVEKVFVGMRCRQGGLLYGKEVDRAARFSLFEMCLKIYIMYDLTGLVFWLRLLFLFYRDKTLYVFSSPLQTVELTMGSRCLDFNTLK